MPNEDVLAEETLDVSAGYVGGTEELLFAGAREKFIVASDRFAIFRGPRVHRVSYENTAHTHRWQP